MPSQITRRQILAFAAATAAVAAMPVASAIAAVEGTPIMTAFKLQGLGEAAEAIRGWHILRKDFMRDGVVDSTVHINTRALQGAQIGDTVTMVDPAGREHDGFVVVEFIPDGDVEGDA